METFSYLLYKTESILSYPNILFLCEFVFWLICDHLQLTILCDNLSQRTRNTMTSRLSLIISFIFIYDSLKMM